jgi:hypothetical protein
MEVSGGPHTLATLLLVPTEQEAEWAPYPVWMWWKREKIPFLSWLGSSTKNETFMIQKPAFQLQEHTAETNVNFLQETKTV